MLGSYTGPLDHFLARRRRRQHRHPGGGTAFNVEIVAQDSANNTVSSYSGTVDLTSNRTCSAGCTQTASFTNGVLSSTSVTLSQVGAATITATDQGGTKTGTSNTFSVNQANPSLALTQSNSPSAGTGTAGTAITAGAITAALSASSGSNAGGTITFYYYQQASAPNPCSSTGRTTIGTATVNGNGNYNPNVGFTPTVAGNTGCSPSTAATRTTT